MRAIVDVGSHFAVIRDPESRDVTCSEHERCNNKAGQSLGIDVD